MRRLVVKAWMSLDGVFDGDSMEQWFNPFQSEARNASIQEITRDSDAILLGRSSYEMLAPYWSALHHNEMGIADKLNEVPKYVASNSLEKADWHNTTILKGDIVGAVRELKQQAGQQILLDGSASLVHSLMETDLIDEYVFWIHPIIMGSGKRFFQDGMPLTKLTLTQNRELDLGVMLQHYKPSKEK
ncbi:dihydrofolate reductase family protein [Fibrivirga algicola]|uniref:Dihydrofolate reductase family protein n=1 Tax=Fibrivirga algicola TaxID=2950420 RepID=A0ABX0QF90_9BACT|nr:dihydrofolate reductase family protein [Fibrivirga algicola]NID09538.1 dihydrofolate reductase family protein [Fibrivirga algicola]